MANKNEVEGYEIGASFYHPIVWVKISMEIAFEDRYLNGVIPITELVALI